MLNVSRQLFASQVLICLLLAPKLHAAEIPVTEAWVVTTSAGEKYSSQYLNVTGRHWLLGRGESIRRFSPQQVLSVMHQHPLSLQVPFKSVAGRVCRLTLSNGDSLTGQLVDFSETDLTFLPAVLAWDGQDNRDAPVKPLEVMLESVAQLEWSAPDGGFSKRESLKPAGENELQQDQLVLSNGDRILGELSDFSPTALKLETDAGAREILIQELSQLRFNPELVIKPTKQAERTLVRLGDGSQVTANSINLVEYNVLLLNTVLAGSWQVPLDSVDSLVSLTESRKPLSERVPDEVTYTPFLSTVPPWQIDANVLGRPMRMQSAGYLTGLGMHPRTELTWSLEEDDQKFLAELGIDDITSGAGSVTFEVLTDGNSVYQSDIIRGGDRAELIQIDLSGKKSLTLRVDFGDRGDVQDRANWGHALILNSQKSPEPSKSE
jgi:hypothetical protein